MVNSADSDMVLHQSEVMYSWLYLLNMIPNESDIKKNEYEQRLNSEIHNRSNSNFKNNNSGNRSGLNPLDENVTITY